METEILRAPETVSVRVGFIGEGYLTGQTVIWLFSSAGLAGIYAGGTLAINEFERNLTRGASISIGTCLTVVLARETGESVEIGSLNTRLTDLSRGLEDAFSTEV